MRFQVVPVCRHLRGRSVQSADGASWYETGDGNRTFWCLCTMDVAGPDDGPVHGESCREGRSCFEARRPDPKL